MTINSLFLRFISFFMSYCPQFWGYRAIYNDLKTRHMFMSYVRKLVVFVFMAIFMSYSPQYSSSRRIFLPHKNSNMFERYDQKIVVFTFYCRFHELLPTILGLQGDLQRP